jgi:PhoPQ-activated pathogenicity-related protein
MVSQTGEMHINWCGFEVKRKFRMRRVVVFTLLVVLSGRSIPTEAQSSPEDTRQSQKAEQNQQKAIAKYNKAQQRAQRKAQEKAEKNQQEAMKRYEKEQQKLLKNTNRPPKPTSWVQTGVLSDISQRVS